MNKFNLQMFGEEEVEKEKSDEIIKLEKELEESQRTLKLKDDELEQLRATLVSDEYLKTLERSEEEIPRETSIDLDSMTNTQLVQYLGKEIAMMIPKVIAQELNKSDVDKMRKQLEELSKENPDWIKYQREMHVLSLEHPEKNAKWLYNEAIKWRSPKPKEEEVATEKPFFGSGNFEPAKEYKTPADAAMAAVKSVFQKAGISEKG
jgi:predicted homoserine dehydrogenase-like protein